MQGRGLIPGAGWGQTAVRWQGGLRIGAPERKRSAALPEEVMDRPLQG